MRRSSPAADPIVTSYGPLLDAVRALRWRARRASRIAVPGIHPSRVHGTSAEFTEYRPYRQGDEVRRIDWRLLARSDRAQIRLSEERAVTPTMLVLDASASLAFPDARSGATSKWALASQLVVGLAAVAQAGGDPVGLTIVGASTTTLPPRTRRGTIAEMIRALAAAKPAGSAPLAPAVAAAARSAVRVAIVTDLLGDADAVLARAREAVVGGRDVHLVQVIAREELDPPATTVIAEDPEASELRRALDRETRAGYLRAFAAWREREAQRWLTTGAAYRVAVTESEPASHMIRRIVRDDPMPQASAS